MATDESPNGGGAVPAWDGESETRDMYVFKVKLYVAGTKSDQRPLCAARLMGRLTGKAIQWVLHYPHMDTLEDGEIVADPHNLPQGVHDLLEFLLEKSGVVPIDDAGRRARKFLRNMDRGPRTAMKDWMVIFEDAELSMTKAFHAIDANIDATVPLFPEPIRAWYLMECAGLSDREKGQVLSSTQNKYDYDLIQKALRAQFDKKHLQSGEHGGGGRRDGFRRRAYFQEASYDEEEPGAWEPECTVDEEAEGEPQEDDLEEDDSVLLAHVDEEGDENLRDELLDRAIYANISGGQRSYKQARDLLKMKRTTRQYFPMPGKAGGKSGKGTSSSSTPSSPPPLATGAALSDGRRPDRPYSGKGQKGKGIQCLRCGGFGHIARNCKAPSSLQYKAPAHGLFAVTAQAFMICLTKAWVLHA